MWLFLRLTQKPSLALAKNLCVVPISCDLASCWPSKFFEEVSPTAVPWWLNLLSNQLLFSAQVKILWVVGSAPSWALCPVESLLGDFLSLLLPPSLACALSKVNENVLKKKKVFPNFFLRRISQGEIHSLTLLAVIIYKFPTVPFTRNLALFLKHLPQVHLPQMLRNVLISLFPCCPALLTYSPIHCNYRKIYLKKKTPNHLA